MQGRTWSSLVTDWGGRSLQLIGFVFTRSCIWCWMKNTLWKRQWELTHPRTAEVKVSWHYMLNRQGKQREAKNHISGHQSWFWAPTFFSSIKNLSILRVVIRVFYDLLQIFDLKRCYVLTHNLQSFKYTLLPIKTTSKTNKEGEYK